MKCLAERILYLVSHKVCQAVSANVARWSLSWMMSRLKVH